VSDRNLENFFEYKADSLIIHIQR